MSGGPISYDDLCEQLQHDIAELQVKVSDLEFESNIYRWVSLIVAGLVVKRIWEWFF